VPSLILFPWLQRKQEGKPEMLQTGQNKVTWSV